MWGDEVRAMEEHCRVWCELRQRWRAAYGNSRVFTRLSGGDASPSRPRRGRAPRDYG